MTAYTAPTRDMQFVINELAPLSAVATLPAFAEQEITSELVEAVLDEAARLAMEVLAPLNKAGDLQGAKMSPHGVIPTPGFAGAYQQFTAGGWNGIACPAEFGGQGLPELLHTAVQEMWNAANMSFALCPILTSGAIETIRRVGSPEQQALYLPKMISGEWTGTMNLTESQAGSDLSAIRARAVPEGDHYRVYGQKIFITWGEHDLTKNTIHLVLARTPGAPDGVKGISLFIVPKFLVHADGSVGPRNDVHAVSLEHKLGIHASPTCVMAFGDHEGAVGYLIGPEHQGVPSMFVMMNEARFKIGLQGIAIAERAYQAAREYAKDRVQGRPIGAKGGDRVNILHHPDVRRMLMTMKSQIEAMRALAYAVACHMDVARHHPDAATRQHHQTRVDLLIPVVKGWSTEVGVELTSLGLQVHGGMGYVEETGACQHLRDARITTIYEGTTGIQAGDLVGRKLRGDQGAAMRVLIAEMQETVVDLRKENAFPLNAPKENPPCPNAPKENPPCPPFDKGGNVVEMATALEAGIGALEAATASVLNMTTVDAMAVSYDYLMLVGTVCGAWSMVCAAHVAQQHLYDPNREDVSFYQSKLITARYYLHHILPKVNGLLASVHSGGETIMALTEEQF